MHAYYPDRARINAPPHLCDWNRLALMPSFSGVVAHAFEALVHSCSSQEEVTQGLNAMTQSRVSDVLLNLEQSAAAQELLHLLQRHQAPVRIWFNLPAAPNWQERQLLDLTAGHPHCGLNLQVDLADCAVNPLHRELERLESVCLLGKRLGWPLRLTLSRIATASQEQLQQCQSFALQQQFARLTLSDEASQLTDLGVRNIFAALRVQAPNRANDAPQLEFLAGNAHGQGLANVIAALKSGARYIHCSLAGCLEQDQPPPLVAVLEQFALPAAQQAGLNRYRDFLSQRDGLAYRSLDASAKPQHGLVAPAGKPGAAAPRSDDLRFVFRVSSDDWHVRLCIEVGDTELDLGERVHHYLLLLLAREYCQQQQRLIQRQDLQPSELDPLSLGWLEREELHRMIGDNEAQFNVKLCRAVKQIGHALQSVGLDSFKPISIRVGSIRLNAANFLIFKDSKLQLEVRDWSQLPSNQARETSPGFLQRTESP
jgi:hypothetical protein